VKEILGDSGHAGGYEIGVNVFNLYAEVTKV